VIDEREGMSIIYVVFMTAVILALVIVFGIRSRYAANPVRRGRHDGAQSSNQFVPGARGGVGETHGSMGDKPDIVGLRGGAARFASPRLFDQ
jgi:hypothetical protein